MDDLVLLHGFAGTGRMWDHVLQALAPRRYRCHAPDIRGHGVRGAVRPISWADCVADVLDRDPGPFVLAGYSFGGRLALHVALAAPERVDRLVLMATTAGLDDPEARAQRAAADEQLAARIEDGDIDDFIAAWTAQPLFADTPRGAVGPWVDDLRRNRPRDLAEVLRRLGTGAMEPMWSRLGELTMPVDVVVGGADAKFLALGERLTGALASARLHVLPDAGHGLPRERPLEIARLLSDPEAGA